MKVSSFDIFDTCLVRKCGTPENFFDVFSLRAFNGTFEEWARQEFVAARRLAERSLWEENPHYTLQDIWNAFNWTHPMLKPTDKLCILEQSTEREMLVPVLKMREKVNECRKRGDKIIFISDMYLSSGFLISVMREHGFYHDGDALYVSCECQASKGNGELFKYVRDKEGLKSFRHWHHYGDNKISDYQVPHKLGIHATLVNHLYSTYQTNWINTNLTTGIKVKSIIAGISHSLAYSIPYNSHVLFLTDIVAPLYSSFVYRIMKDATNRGIKRLYFCARDAYTVYLVALKYHTLFPDIEVKYLYISQLSLYYGNQDAAMKYFFQEGLATTTEQTAIVDIRSKGKTITYLNKMLENKGYNRAKGYYFEILKSYNYAYVREDVITEWQDVYAKLNPCCARISSYWQLYEMFFSIHNQNRTIDYEIREDGVVRPIFDEARETDEEEKKVGNGYVVDSKRWEQVHQNIILSFVDAYISTKMYLLSDYVYNEIAMSTFISFMSYPEKEYSIALEDFYVYSNVHEKYIPYVKKENLLRLVLTRATDTYWKRATKILSAPQWLVEWYIKNQA